MASSSAIVNPLVGIAITQKLAKTSHAMWKAHILVVVRGSLLVGHLIGETLVPAVKVDGKDDAGKVIKVVNPAYEEWYAKDQQVMSFILGSLGRDILAQVAAKETTIEVWSAIEVMYPSQNRARAVNTRLALAATQKGNIWPSLNTRALGDEMATEDHFKKRSS